MPTRETSVTAPTKAFLLRLVLLLALLFLLAGAAASPSRAEGESTATPAPSSEPPANAANDPAADPSPDEDAAEANEASGAPVAEDGTDEKIEAAARRKLGARPVARADAYNVSQDKARVVKAPGVLANDSKRRAVFAKFVLGVEYGKLSLNKYGGFSYTPDANFRGTDYFKYRICERRYPSRCSAAAAVKLTVQGAAPVARDDTILAKKNHTKTVESPGVKRNDYDPNGDTTRVISYTQPRRGGVIVGTAGNLRFRPDRNFTGRTSFRYWIGDGTGLRASARVTFRVRG